MNLLIGRDHEVAAWAGSQLGVTFQEPFTAFGVVDGAGRMRGATVFNDFYPGGNIEMTHVGRGTLSRSVQKAIAEYAFRQCGATRLTAKTPRGNALVRKLLPKAGFRFEGTQRRYFGPGKSDDALVFVLFSEDAVKWLET